MESSQETVSPFESKWSKYLAITMKGDDNEVRKFIAVAALDIENLRLRTNANALINDKEREMKYDILGKKRIIESHFHKLRTLTLSDLLKTLSKVPDT
jgi:hypothetical protein